MELHHESLGRIKMALAGTDTSSLIEILEGSFGCVDLNVSTSSASTEIPVKKLTVTNKPSENPSQKISVPFLRIVV